MAADNGTTAQNGLNGDASRDAMPVTESPSPRLGFPVVGIGASAGGLEAFIEFFDAMPPNHGLAFVLVQHLSPKHESMVAELLQKHTTMPVHQVEDGMPVEPDHVYVIRPGHTMTIKDGHLRLGESLLKPGHSRPVDDFFRSLAEEQHERAICVILSGMGSNGTAGAQAVKVVGGLGIAQEPNSAKFPSMPRSMIEANLADFILKPSEMPDVLLRYAGHAYARDETPADLLARSESHQINDILAILRARVRHDFSGYKRPTIVRRIQRRMSLTQNSSMSDYARVLRQTPAEVHNLADDLMIHVTGFFRDAEVWEGLRERVILPMVAEKADMASIRVWVTACASGEEAYTLAMLLVEAAEQVDKQFDIKVFATDMAERALQHARAGIFPGGIESEIAPERLARFFDRDDSMYRVKKHLRELVVFAPQNVLQDPPFSRLDIVTCRNLLIYLEPEVQNRVLSLLHFGLREGGTLVLGNSETIGDNDELFEAIDKKLRLYRRVGPTRHGMINFPGRVMSQTVSGITTDSDRPLSRANLSQATAKTLLDRLSPPSVVVDRHGRIVYFHGETNLFLTQPSGEPTRDVLEMAQDFVRGPIRVALHQAIETDKLAVSKDGVIDIEELPHRVEIHAMPVEQRSLQGYYLVSFVHYPISQLIVKSDADDGEPEGTLQNELRTVRDELQSTIEELQTSNEEMKASHEEVTSVNEELQSTNEELETSKEELQSLNEELTTVNAQLSAKMEELEGTSNDLASLLASSDTATIFLDRQFRIRRFTPATKPLIELIPADVGRPLTDFARKFEDPTLNDAVREVLATLLPHQATVVSNAGRTFVRRVLPYRTADDRIDGVVINFLDVTDVTHAERSLRQSEEQQAFLLRLSDVLRPLSDPVAIEVAANRVLGERLGVSRSFYCEVEPDEDHIVVHRDYTAPGIKSFAGRMRISDFGSHWAKGYRSGRTLITTDIRTVNGTEPAAIEAAGFEACVGVPVHKAGRLVGILVVHSATPRQWTPLEVFLVEETAERTWNAVERARAEVLLRDSENRYAALAGNLPQGAAFVVNTDLRYTLAEGQALRDAGLTPADFVGKTIVEAMPPEFVEAYTSHYRAALAGVPFRVEHAAYGREYITHGVPLRDTDGRIYAAMAVSYDITDRKEIEADRATLLSAEQHARTTAESANATKDRFLANLGHELRTPLSAMLIWSELLQGQPDAATLAEGLAAIQQSAKAQQNLINDLLDSARVATGKMLIERLPVELGEVIRSAVATLRPTADAKGIELNVDIGKTVGIVMADADRLRQVVWNLVSNAIKFTPAEGRVDVGVWRRDGTIEIRVSDTGAGIDAELLPEIFGRFHQADASLTRRFGGLGLGLSISRQIVELHGGTIQAASDGPGQGSVFTVFLPLPRAKSTTRPPVATKELAGLRIVLVEDDASLREVVTMLLRRAGGTVESYDRAEPAQATLLTNPPHILLCDIGLPDKDGYALIREFRSQEPSGSRLPAIAFTAFDRPQDRAHAIECGFDDHLAKPVSPAKLSQAIQRLVKT